MIPVPDHLPNLLYAGDVDVQSYCHGSTLLYRLFECYPPEKLTIVELNASASELDRRLRGPRYEHAPSHSARFFNSRWLRWSAPWLAYLKRFAPLPSGLLQAIEKHQPGAIVTVAHGFTWISVARHAIRERIPLVLIIHDDWPSYLSLNGIASRLMLKVFDECCRGACVRFCVSPYMAQAYERRCGAKAHLLYPTWAANTIARVAPASSTLRQGDALSVAFAGTIYPPGYVRLLRNLAETLASMGGFLNLYGPFTALDLERLGLDLPNIQHRGMFPAGELVTALRQDADVLYVPMSFDASERSNMTLCFPSKLADYTAAGLPILIQGPSYASAVRWAAEYPQAAVVVTEESNEALSRALTSLTEPERRQELALGALQAGSECFSAERGHALFLEALSSLRPA